MTKKLTLAERKKRKAELATEIRKHYEDYQKRREEGGEAWPDETREAWESVNKEYDENEKALIDETNDDEIRSRVEQIREDEEKSIRSGKPRPGLDDRIPGTDETYGDRGLDREGAEEYAQRQKQRRLAFRAWMIAEEAPELINDEMRQACHDLRMSPNRRHIDINTLDTRGVNALKRSMGRMSQEERELAIETGEVRALSTITAGAGPELIPASFVNVLEMAMLAYGNMLVFIDQRVTDAGEPMNWTIGDDTSNEGAWVGAEGEDTQVVGEPNPEFIRQTWGAHELHSKWVKVPFALNEDSMWDLETELAKILGERLGRSRNRAATVGTGVGQSRGITLDAPLGYTTAAATAIAYDDVTRFEHSVDPDYREESMYMFHDDVLLVLRLLKDGEGRPLWQQSVRDGTPDRINNRPYAYNQHMEGTLATGNISMIFGRLRDYKERRVRAMRIIRATERFAEKLQNGYLGYMRADGKLQRPTSDARTSVKRMEQG